MVPMEDCDFIDFEELCFKDAKMHTNNDNERIIDIFGKPYINIENGVKKKTYSLVATLKNEDTELYEKLQWHIKSEFWPIDFVKNSQTWLFNTFIGFLYLLSFLRKGFGIIDVRFWTLKQRIKNRQKNRKYYKKLFADLSKAYNDEVAKSAKIMRLLM